MCVCVCVLHFNLTSFLFSLVLSSITSSVDIQKKYKGENLRQRVQLKILVSVFFCHVLKVARDTTLEDADKLLSYFTVQSQKCAFIIFFVAFEQFGIRQHYWGSCFFPVLRSGEK